MGDLYDLVQETSKQLKKHFPKFKFPPEVELMRELNDANRGKYERWLYKKKITDKLLGKSPFPECSYVI